MISKPVDWVVDMKSMSRLNLISFPPSPSFMHYGILFTISWLWAWKDSEFPKKVKKKKKVRGLAVSERDKSLGQNELVVSHLKQGMTYVSAWRHCASIFRIAHRIKLVARTLHYSYSLLEDFENISKCKNVALMDLRNWHFAHLKKLSLNAILLIYLFFLSSRTL